MFSLSITIRPNHELLSTAGFVKYIGFNRFLVVLDHSLNWRIEEVIRLTRPPFPMSVKEIIRSEMSSNGSDGECGISLGIVEVIVLDKTRRRITLRAN